MELDGRFVEKEGGWRKSKSQIRTISSRLSNFSYRSKAKKMGEEGINLLLSSPGFRNPPNRVALWSNGCSSKRFHKVRMGRKFSSSPRRESRTRISTPAHLESKTRFFWTLSIVGTNSFFRMGERDLQL